MATKCKTVTSTATNTIGSPTLTAKQLKNKLKPRPLVAGEERVVNLSEPRNSATSPSTLRNSPTVGMTNSRNIPPSLHKRVDRSPSTEKSLNSGPYPTMSPNKKPIQEGISKSSVQSVKSAPPKPVKPSSMPLSKSGIPQSKRPASPLPSKSASPSPSKSTSPQSVRPASPSPSKTSPKFVKPLSPKSLKSASPQCLRPSSPSTLKSTTPPPVKPASPVSLKSASTQRPASAQHAVKSKIVTGPTISSQSSNTKGINVVVVKPVTLPKNNLMSSVPVLDGNRIRHSPKTRDVKSKISTLWKSSTAGDQKEKIKCKNYRRF